MKKLLYLFVASVLAAASCAEKTGSVVIPVENIEIVGDGFTLVKVYQDVKLFITESENGSTLTAMVGVVKAKKDKLPEITMTLDLLDKNGMKLNDYFGLVPDGLDEILPALNASDADRKNIPFKPSEAGAWMKRSRIEDLLERTGGLKLNISTVDKAAASGDAGAGGVAGGGSSAKGLAAQYGLEGYFSRYERAYRQGRKSEWMEIDDRIEDILKKVDRRSDLSKKAKKDFKDYVYARLNGIEDKVEN